MIGLFHAFCAALARCRPNERIVRRQMQLQDLWIQAHAVWTACGPLPDTLHLLGLLDFDGDLRMDGLGEDDPPDLSSIRQAVVVPVDRRPSPERVPDFPELIDALVVDASFQD